MQTTMVAAKRAGKRFQIQFHAMAAGVAIGAQDVLIFNEGTKRV